VADIAENDSNFSAVLIEKGGRFYFYQPGLGVIGAGATIAEAYAKFSRTRTEFLEEAKNASLTIDRRAPVADGQSTVAISEGSMWRELALFFAKLCIVLIVIAGIGGVGAWSIARSVGKLSLDVNPLSLDDIARKSEEVARDIKTTPNDSKELLRRSVAAISRAIGPLVDAWRNPSDIPEPVRPEPKSSN